MPTRPPLTRFLAFLLLLGVLALPYLFFDGFHGLQIFDDEGILMITIRDLKQGLRLYDDSYALYGPFYYRSVGALFTTLHLPLNHDTLRLVSSVFRVACAGLLATLTFRLSRSITGGMFTALALLVLYRFMPHSPTHPQELCLLLVAAVAHLLLSLETAGPRLARWLTAAIGACLAALLLTKINIGVFASLAVVLTGLRGIADVRLGRLVTVLAAIAAVLLPFVLMLPLLHLPWAAFYCLAATATIGATLVAYLNCERHVWLTGIGILSWVAGAAVVAVATLGVTLADGSSFYAMLSAVVLQNGHLIRNWYIELPFSPASIAAAPVALLAALAYRLRAAWVVGLAKLLVGAGGVILLLPMMLGFFGLWDTKWLVLQLVTPFVFLLLLPADQPIGAGRIGLVLLATFMMLYAFPVAGDQVAVAGSLTIACLPLFVQDGLAALRLPTLRRSAFAVGSLFAAVACIGLVQMTRHAWWNWGGGVSTDLPGARLVHVSRGEYTEWHWAVQRLESCPSFYTLPGLMSFYLWTGRPSPTSVNSNDTLGLLTTEQQDRVVVELSRQRKLCVLVNPGLLDRFDRGQIASNPPLLRLLADRYTTADQFGPYVLLMPKGE